MWNEILTALKTIVASLEAQAVTDLSILLTFFKELVTEEEAALFPDFQALATKILNDEAAIQGLNVDQRVAVIVADFVASFPQEVSDAKKALYSSWGYAIAYKTGQSNGNQGSSTAGDFSGNTNPTPATPAA